MPDSIDTNGSSRIAFTRKFRALAAGAMACAALSVPAVSAVSVVAHQADRHGAPIRFSPDSHRLALTVVAHSVRLT